MHSIVTLDVTYWNLLITMVLPAAVALVNTRFAPGHVKALTLVGLSIVGGLLNQVVAQGGSFEVGKTLWYVVVTFAGAALIHFGLLAPLAVTGANGAIAKNLPGGLGPVGTDKAPLIVPGTVVSSDPAPPVTAPGAVTPVPGDGDTVYPPGADDEGR
jgi:hypothetical protein